MYTSDVAETAYHASQQRATKSAEFSRSKLTSAGEPEILSSFKYVYEALGISNNEEEDFHNHFK